jgi:hypothetical protein
MTKMQQKYIDALESGQYRQIFDNIRIGDCFCAIGVGYDIIGPNYWCKYKNPNNNIEHYRTMLSYNDINSAFDLEKQTLYNDVNETIGTIILNMNDKEKKSFQEIADYLKQVWKSGS